MTLQYNTPDCVDRSTAYRNKRVICGKRLEMSRLVEAFDTSRLLMLDDGLWYVFSCAELLDTVCAACSVRLVFHGPRDASMRSCHQTITRSNSVGLALNADAVLVMRLHCDARSSPLVFLHR